MTSKVNIQEVANIAGVSKSTVSKVINDHPTIPSKTKDRINAIIKKLNYTPNPNAKNLAKKRSGSISLIIDVNKMDFFNDVFFSNIILGIEKHALSKELDLTIFNVNHVESTASFMSTFIRGKKSDGIIIPVSILDKSILQLLNKNKFPFVILGDPRADVRANWIDFDNRQGSINAVMHLHKNGYKNIAYIGGTPDSPLSVARFEGYKKAIELLKLPYKIENVRKALSSVDAGREAMIGFQKLNERPDALLCEDNYYLFGAYKEILRSKLTIPDDVGIVTFNDHPFAPYLEPAVSAIEMDTFTLGTECAKTLIDLIERPSRKAASLILSPTLIPRESSAPRKTI